MMGPPHSARLPPVGQGLDSSRRDKKVVLSSEALEKSLERLVRSRPPKDWSKEPPLTPRLVRTQAQLDSQVERLYDQGMARTKRREEATEAAEQKGLHQARQLSEEEMLESIGRQYTQAVDRRRATEERLRTRYLYVPKPPQRLAKDRAARLYTDGVERHSAAKRRLDDKYVTGSMPPSPRRTADELKESSARLCRRER